MTIIFWLAIIIAGLGLMEKFASYGLNRLTRASEMTPRAPAAYQPDRKSMIAGLWRVNVTSYKFWWQANPAMLIGHILYHVGLFTAMGVYAVVGLVAATHISYGSIPERVIAVCDWVSHKDIIFSGGPWQVLLGQVAMVVFGGALIMAVTGISTPFIMSLLGKRGAIRPLDQAMKMAGISRISGLKARSSAVGYQRKVVGLMVLIMDWLMLIAYFFPLSAHYTSYIHLSFTFMLIGLLPTSFLFHEIYRPRMWSGVRRVMDGRTA